MRHHPLPITVAAVTCGLLASAVPSQATSLATWVSGTGTDSGACSRTAPCRTFQFAYSQTTAGGVINVLSPGSFGKLIITKTISIVADGVEALIQSAVACPGGGTAAVCISAANQVNLRGLTIDLNLTDTWDGIRFNSGGSLYVQNCVIRRVGSNGINFQPSAAAQLSVSKSTVASNKNAGILFMPRASGNYFATLDRINAEGNSQKGISFDGQAGGGNILATVRDSVAAGNADGITVFESGSGTTKVMIDRTEIVNNISGLSASGATATALIGDSTVSGNFLGLGTLSSGSIKSFKTNKVSGNIIDGDPTSTIGMK